MGYTERPQIGIGYRVGKLTVVFATDQRKNGYTIWNCRCDCGREIRLDTRTLQRRTVTDCGCISNVKPGQKDLTGQRFGCLVCIESTAQRGQNGSVIWKCRCDCGNECLAVARQLTQGYKKSCGCMSHPPIKDYTGKRFGNLTVQGYYGKEAGMHRWECLCDCGNITIVGQTLLQSGKTKSCGCLGHPPVQDIQGKVFGKLTAVEFDGNRNGQYYWRCICQCGKETIVRQNYLLTGKTKSCGCLQATQITRNLKLYEGTSVARLEASREKRLASNTSGYTGVYQNKKTGKWIAQITFKRKTYYLGSYDKIEDAVKARQRGEKMHDDFLEWYYKNVHASDDAGECLENQTDGVN